MAEITEEEAWQIFCDILKRSNIDCSNYRTEFEADLPIILRARSKDEAVRLIQYTADEIIRRERPAPQPAPRPQPQPTSPVRGTVRRGQVFVAPSSVPMEMIKQALEQGGSRSGFGSAKIAAIADRLKTYGELMVACTSYDGYPLSECYPSTKYAGAVLQRFADEIARNGAMYPYFASEMIQGSLYQMAVTTVLRPYLRILPPGVAGVQINGIPLYKGLGATAVYEIARYFGLDDVRQEILPVYRQFYDGMVRLLRGERP